jgi:disulfide bond formation protein DsbB
MMPQTRLLTILSKYNIIRFLPLIFFAVPLIIAYFSEFALGQEPCKLCLWQRYPYWLGLIPAAIYMYQPQKYLLYITALLMLISTGIAFYHAGVEEHLWSSSCSAQNVDALGSVEQMRNMIHDNIPDCGKPFHLIKGISMAKLNVIYSLCVTIYILYLTRRTIK